MRDLRACTVYPWVLQSMQSIEVYALSCSTLEQCVVTPPQARRLLARAARALRTARIPFWIGSGTLLGWYRQVCSHVTVRCVTIGT
jgi:hypothetical protein